MSKPPKKKVNRKETERIESVLKIICGCKDTSGERHQCPYVQREHLKCEHVGQRSGQSSYRFVPPHSQQIHTSSPILVIMLALLRPLTWCSWGEDAGRRPKEELGDELAKAPPAGGRESVGKPMAGVSLYGWPGPMHVLHLRWPHTGQH